MKKSNQLLFFSMIMAFGTLQIASASTCEERVIETAIKSNLQNQVTYKEAIEANPKAAKHAVSETKKNGEVKELAKKLCEQADSMISANLFEL